MEGSNEVATPSSILSPEDIKEKKKKSLGKAERSSLDGLESPSPSKVLEVIPRKEK